MRDDAGNRQMVRNGYGPERKIQTGIGEVKVRVPKVADRRKESGSKIKFSSSILPPYLRRTKSIEDLLPWLYLKGISTGDFGEALTALLGKNAPGLSASTISRLKEVWQEELKVWQQNALSEKERSTCIFGLMSAFWRANGGCQSMHVGSDRSNQEWRQGAARDIRRIQGE